MSYNRVRTPKFYIDAVLLARQWGALGDDPEAHGKYFLNPSNVTTLPELSAELNEVYFTINFENRYWINSLSHCFVLGHNFATDELEFFITSRIEGGENTYHTLADKITPNVNGWSKLSWVEKTDYTSTLLVPVIRSIEDTTLPNDRPIRLGDISVGWSYEMPHSPDLELTQGISNESIKTQTTKGGHTLTNAGYNQQPNWIRQPWTTGTTTTVAEGRTVFPVGRRSWNLKFSYISDTDLFPSSYNSATGIFQWTGISDDPDTEEDETQTFYSIKDNFVDKVYHGTNGFQLPFIFQPDSNTEEYAICRINNDSVSFNQTSHNVYDISLDIIEAW